MPFELRSTYAQGEAMTMAAAAAYAYDRSTRPEENLDDPTEIRSANTPLTPPARNRTVTIDA
jgi:hypothetical protein